MPPKDQMISNLTSNDESIEQELEDFLAENMDEFSTEQQETDETQQVETSDVSEAENTNVQTGEESHIQDQASTQELDETSVDYWKNRAALLEQHLSDAVAAKASIESNKPDNVDAAKADDDKIPDLFTDWDFAKIIENEDNFKQFLTSFADKITTKTEERMLRKLPSTVASLATERIEAQEKVKTFYTTHEALASVKPFVGQIVSTIASEHADWGLDDVLAEAAKRAYKALGLREQTAGVSTKRSDSPAFASQSRGNRRSEQSPVEKTRLEQELTEILELEN